MILLPNEEELLSSNAGEFTLTNYRVVQNNEVWGKSYKIFIPLEKISSVESNYKSNVALLGAAAIIAVYGFIVLKGFYLVLALLLAAACAGLWWMSRKHHITITSDGGKSINFLVEQMSDDQIDEFLGKIQEAKSNRIQSLI